MKTKGLLVIISIFFVFVIAACRPGEQIDADALIIEAQSQVDLPTQTTSNVTLPTAITVSGQSIVVSWSSANSTIISNTGVVTRPSHEAGNEPVVLTATFTLLGQSITQTYTVIVVALDAVNFTITFESNGGTSVGQVTVQSGQSLTEPTPPTRNDFTFDGWFKEAALTNAWNFTIDTVTANTTLYAKWTPLPTYIATFNPNNGEAEFTQSIIEGGLLSTPAVPIKAGYEFLEWRKADDQSSWIFATQMVTSNVGLIAHYAPLIYTITYTLPDGAQHTGPFDTSFTILDQVNDLGSVTIPNGNFDGWYDQAQDGNRVNFIPAGTIGNITLYARIIYFDIFTVTFDDGFGEITSIERYDGQTIDPINPENQQGYTFMGWYLDLLDDEPFNFSTFITEDINLIGKWEPVTYNITYHLDGGSASNPMQYNIQTPTVTLNQATKDGFEFIGWFDAQSGGNQVIQILLGSMGHVTLYARYQTITYNITYELNQGVASNPATYTILTQTIILFDAEKEGYQFVAWENEDGDVITEIPQGSMGHLTLYAIFVELIEISFYDNVESPMTDLYSNNMFPSTQFAVLNNNRLFSLGSNASGLLGIGEDVNSKEYSDEWVEVKGFDVGDGEDFISVWVYQSLVIVVTDQDRIFVWGFLGYDEDDEMIIETAPVEVTHLFNFTGDIKDVLHYGWFFVIQTTADELYMFKAYNVTDVKPNLNPNEIIAWAHPFQYGDQAFSGAFYTGERIFMLDVDQPNGFVDVTIELNLHENAQIKALLYQHNSIHVVTESAYYFGGFGQMSEEDPYGFMSMPGIPLELTLNPNESILSVVSGASLWTSQGRILTPVYIINSEEDDFPSLIKFVDMTDALGLEEGETVVDIYAPFMFYTSLERLLVLTINTPFTMNAEELPEFDQIEILNGTSDLIDGQLISAYLHEFNILIKTDVGLYMPSFEQTGIVFELLMIETLQEVYSGLYPIDGLDELFEPTKDVPYMTFDAWFIDIELKTPFDQNNAYDGMILYAGYRYTHYKIQFMLNWDQEQIDPIWTPFGEVPVKPNDPEQAFATFGGWYYIDEDFNTVMYDFDVALDDNVDLYPWWIAVEFEITLIYDLTDETITNSATANTPLEWLYIQVPMGYEIIGLYYDQDYLMAVDLEEYILSDLTIYVALEPIVVTIYYFDDVENVTFVEIFGSDQYNFGVTADQKVYAWGTNNNGSLGIGFDYLYNFQTPFEWTLITELGAFETIVEIFSYQSIHVMVTTERIFMWGHYDQTLSQYVSIPQDITNQLSLAFDEQIIGLLANFSEIVFLTSHGQIITFDTFENQIAHVQTFENFNDIIFTSFVLYSSEKLFVVTQTELLIITLDKMELQATTTDLNHVLLEDETLLYAYRMGYGTSDLYIITSFGRIFSFDELTESMTLQFLANLNEDETVLKVIIGSVDEIYYLTQERFIKVYEGVQNVYDTSILLENEMIIDMMYGIFLSNFGRAFTINDDTLELEFMNQQYVLEALETILYFQMVNGGFLAYTSDSRYLLGVGVASEFEILVGTELIIDYVVFGDVYTLRTPDEKLDYIFDGWAQDILSSWWFVNEVSYDTPLYAIYSLIE